MHPSGSLPVHFTCYMYIVVLDFPLGTGHKVEEWGGVDQDQKKIDTFNGTKCPKKLKDLVHKYHFYEEL